MPKHHVGNSRLDPVSGWMAICVAERVWNLWLLAENRGKVAYRQCN
ncbi:MAG: hypothetical protein LBE12_06265 [Planctomycetaceae bacterium]|nr:hypothetical protein [Planctomycetaceae bacterium]